MFSLDVTAPSITIPHVRGRRVSMTQSKLYSHGRIYMGLFHSSTSLSPSSLCYSLQCYFVLADASLSFPVCLFFFHLHFFLFLDNRYVQSFFNGARNYISSGTVQYYCPLFSQYNKDISSKKIRGLCFDFHYNLSFSEFLSSWFKLFLLARHSAISYTVLFFRSNIYRNNLKEKKCAEEQNYNSFILKTSLCSSFVFFVNTN